MSKNKTPLDTKDQTGQTNSPRITKDMTFAEIMELDKDAARKLGERGLFCGGCPMAAFETLEGGAIKHGVDVDDILEELNSDGR